MTIGAAQHGKPRRRIRALVFDLVSRGGGAAPAGPGGRGGGGTGAPGLDAPAAARLAFPCARLPEQGRAATRGGVCSAGTHIPPEVGRLHDVMHGVAMSPRWLKRSCPPRAG
eukprot:351465-Chlamydomonas_euryale.AAC.7